MLPCRAVEFILCELRSSRPAPRPVLSAETAPGSSCPARNAVLVEDSTALRAFERRVLVS